MRRRPVASPRRGPRRIGRRAHPERAADIAGDDPHPVGGDIEARREVMPQHDRALRRAKESVAATPRVEARERAARLHRGHDDALVDGSYPRDMPPGRKSRRAGRGRPGGETVPVDRDIARCLGPDQRRSGFDRASEVGDRLACAVLDRDRLRPVARRRLGLGDDKRGRVPHVDHAQRTGCGDHHVGAAPARVIALTSRAPSRLQVGRRWHRDHPRHRQASCVVLAVAANATASGQTPRAPLGFTRSSSRNRPAPVEADDPRSGVKPSCMERCRLRCAARATMASIACDQRARRAIATDATLAVLMPAGCLTGWKPNERTEGDAACWVSRSAPPRRAAVCAAPLRRAAMISLDLLINAIVAGVLLGGFYAAVSVGITISFGMLDIANIAQPAFILLGSTPPTSSTATGRPDPDRHRDDAGVLPIGDGGLQRALLPRVREAGRPGDRGLAFFFGLLFIGEVSLVLVFGVDYRFVEASYIGPAIKMGILDLPLRMLIPFVFSLLMIGGMQLFLIAQLSRTSVLAVAGSRRAAADGGEPAADQARGGRPLDARPARLAGSFMIIIQPVEPSIGATISAASSRSACSAE